MRPNILLSYAKFGHRTELTSWLVKQCKVNVQSTSIFLSSLSSVTAAPGQTIQNENYTKVAIAPVG